MLNITQMRKAFNQAASTAGQADFLQCEIANRFMECLPMIRFQPRRILECGARTGYLSQQLLGYYPNAELIAVDYADQQLLKINENRCIKTAAYYTTLPFKNHSVDMVASSLSLHWTNDLVACFREFKRVLQPNGLLIFTMLGMDTLKELRQSFLTCKEYCHYFPDMHDIGDLLLQSGFENPVMDTDRLTIRYKQLMTLFQDFKFSGTGNAHQKQPKGLFGKHRWNDALAHYDTLKEDGAYPATFEIIYGHAWQAQQENQTAMSESIINFQ